MNDEDRKARELGYSSATAMRYPARDEYRQMTLEEENFHLRKQIESLMKQLIESRERHTLLLPRPTDNDNHTYTVPFRVGAPSLLAAAATGAPQLMYHYRMIFEKEWCERGVFWRALPFSTEPENWRR